MDSGRIFFDGSRRGNVLVLGNVDSVFRGPGSLARMEETSKRRPFFSCSPDELIIEEEYYDEQLPENKKRRLTSEQVFMLEKSFEAENKLEPERKTQLAKKLGLQPRQVAVWFQNRRARWKTKQLEKDYDSLKDTYDSLLSRHDAIVIENEKLKSQVASLNEKLQAKEAVGSVELVGGRGLGPVVVSAHEVGVHGNYDDHPEGIVSVLHGNVNKGEDHLSSTGSGGGGGSALVDDDGPQLMDSGHSYFDADDDYHGCIGRVVVDGVQSEEDDGRDDFSEVFGATAAEQPQHAIGLWVWP